MEFVTGLKDSVYVSGQIGLNPCPVIAGDKKVTVHSHVDFCVANAHSVTGLPQKKGVNPNYCYNQTEIKYVKDVSCVGHLSYANLVTNVPTVAIDPPVEKWQALGSSPKVVTTLREGYTLPFRFRLNQVTNCHKQLSQPIQTGPPFRGTVSAGEQKCSRTGSKPKLTRVLQPAIFGTQTQQLVEIYLGPEHLKHLPKHRVVMETPETIRTSLRLGEWVTSIDFKDTYFHIPIHSQSMKYMRFHLQGRSYQFKALRLGLSTARMEFTVVAKEVKLMALQRGIRIHQYLDDWLLRTTSHQTCLQHTQTLVALCRELGWLVNSSTSGRSRSDPYQSVGRP